ncbi:GGDEF domain-containing protein [Patescibacteria group bacterium]|nr:GGDEF domain-containing protein [Patescibacteria group bacterium]
MPDMTKTEITSATDVKIAEAHEWNEIIDSVAGKDHLTGLPNRRVLIRAFGRESERAVRHKRPLAALFLDIDAFKEYNDSHGHLAGDKVLQSLAQTLRKETRNVDVLARYGGEECMILLPETDLQKALEVAERIRLATTSDLAAGRPAGNGKILRDITISVGAAQWQQGQNFDDFASLADEAMYYAKQQGRNRVAGATENKRMIEYGAGWSQQ